MKLIDRCLLFACFLPAPALISAQNHQLTCPNPNQDPRNLDTRGVLNWPKDDNHGGDCILPRPKDHRPHYPGNSDA